MSKRIICTVTGSRAEYGLLRPVMRAIEANPRLALKVAAAGMHLSPAFGMTVNQISKEFAVSARVPMTPAGDSQEAMALSLARGVSGITKAFKKIRPDVVLVLGDRIEALAAALAATYLGLPLAHIHGGDRSGTIDENVRHAITKLAHVHFAASRASAKRIRRMGEQASRVHEVGAPGLDGIRPSAAGIKVILKKYKLAHPFVLLVQHPDTTAVRAAAAQMRSTLDALLSLGLPIVALYPNADAGGRAMIAVLEAYAKKHPSIALYKSIAREEYLALLCAAQVLVGNSSSGMIEAPFLNKPVVNIGERQQGREHGSGVVHAPHETRAILRAVKKALVGKKRASTNPYGDGRASQRIARVLASIKLGPKLLQKQMTY